MTRTTFFFFTFSDLPFPLGPKERKNTQLSREVLRLKDPPIRQLKQYLTSCTRRIVYKKKESRLIHSLPISYYQCVKI